LAFDRRGNNAWEIWMIETKDIQQLWDLNAIFKPRAELEPNDGKAEAVKSMLEGDSAEATAGKGNGARSAFRYSAGTFVKLDGDRWVERRDKDVESQFIEKRRTAQYVELYDGSRDLNVRLFDHFALWLDTKTGQWHSWPGSEGHWQR
jgi:hypothetical protein